MIQGPGQFANTLRGLLESQLEAIERLADLLQKEHLALESGLADELDGITVRKPGVLGELERLIAEQSALLIQLGFDATPAGLRQAIYWCDSGGVLNALQERVATRLSDCGAQNTHNGVLVQMRIGFVRRALQSLRGPEYGDPTYGRDGRCQQHDGCRLLGSV